MIPRVLRFLVVLLGVLFAPFAEAQLAIFPRPPSIDSIEVQVADSATVVLGTAIKPVTKDRYAVSTATIRVTETLKGPPQETLFVFPKVSADTIERWQTARSRLLVLAESGSSRNAAILDLDNPKLLVSRKDFTLIRDPRELLGVVRDLIREPTKTLGPGSFVRPPPENDIGRRWTEAFPKESDQGLVVPIDDDLQRWARDAIRSGPLSRSIQGVGALERLPDEENVVLLKSLLKDGQTADGPEVGLSSGSASNRSYPLRAAAFDALLALGVMPPPVPILVRVPDYEKSGYLVLRPVPSANLDFLRGTRRLATLVVFPAETLSTHQVESIASAPNLTRLMIRNGGIDGARLKRLAALQGLQALDLSGNPITDADLPLLARFPKLRDVSLEGTQVTPAGLESLRRLAPSVVVGSRSEVNFGRIP